MTPEPAICPLTDGPAPADAPPISRRAVLAAGLSTGAVLLGGGTAQAAATTTSFDPPGRTWLTGSFDYDLAAGSPYLITYDRPYALTKNIGTDPTTGDGTVLDGEVVRARIGGRWVPQMVSKAWYLLPQIASYRLDENATRRRIIDKTLMDSYLLAWRHSARRRLRPGAAPDVLWWVHTALYKGGTVELPSPQWVSAMTQGMALSVLATWYETTGDPRWYRMMTQTYRSYRHYRNTAVDQPNGFWFVGHSTGADGRSRTWFEEYPSMRAGKIAHVVNGYIYAIWGLYDYYRVTRDPEAKVLLDRSLATLRDSFSLYRYPGGPSWYAMTPWGRTAWGRPTTYHYGVSSILQTTGRITRDATFTTQGRTLAADWSPAPTAARTTAATGVDGWWPNVGPWPATP